MTIAIIDGDVLLYQSMWGCVTIEEGQEKFKEVFDDAMESMFATDYVMALGGPDNFRLDIFPDYKGNRKKVKDSRPSWFGDLKSWIIDNYPGSILSDNCEADDMVRVWATQCKDSNLDFIVCSVDKDLNCIVGPHYNPRTRQILNISDNYAERFYWEQILTGDSTDNIPGIYRCGPVKAKKILENAFTRKELQSAVCVAYKDSYQEHGYSHLISNSRLIHIWRYIDDYFKITREFYDDAIKE
jgi:5'-3' exonuclease